MLITSTGMIEDAEIVLMNLILNTKYDLAYKTVRGISNVIGTFEPEHDLLMKSISRTENENPNFHENHEFGGRIPTRNEILMKA